MENPTQPKVSVELSVQVSPADIEYFEEVSGKQWTGDCAVFSSNTGMQLSHFCTTYTSNGYNRNSQLSSNGQSITCMSI